MENKLRITYKIAEEGKEFEITCFVSKELASEIKRKICSEMSEATEIAEENTESSEVTMSVTKEESNVVEESVETAEDNSETTGTTVEREETIYQRVLNFIKESEKPVTAKDITTAILVNRGTLKNYLRDLLLKGEIKHPDGKIRWYCANTENAGFSPEEVVTEGVNAESIPEETTEEVKEESLSEEVTEEVKEEWVSEEGVVKEETQSEVVNMQPEEAIQSEVVNEQTEEATQIEEKDSVEAQLEEFLSDEIDDMIVSYILTRSKFLVERARRKFREYEDRYCCIINFLNEIGWIEFLEEEENAYKVRGYAIIWYLLKKAAKPLTLDEIVEQGGFQRKEQVERVMKMAIVKGVVEKTTEDEEERYVAK